jgi:hypothetical protein
LFSHALASRQLLPAELTGMVTCAEIGIGLTGFGFVLTFLGVLFFFDKGLLAMGNVRALPFPHFRFESYSCAMLAFADALAAATSTEQ